MSTACTVPAKVEAGLAEPDLSALPQPGSQPVGPAELDVSADRQSQDVVVSGGFPAPYNYGPTVMREADRYRVWWCSQLPEIGPAGDDILHASAPQLDAAFGSDGAPAVPVFNGRFGGFDGAHTCDPSVVKAGDTYYLYYTGASGDHAHGNAIGVASSPDGLAWRREAQGKPVITVSNEVHRENVYGAGQPSAVYLDGWFYLMFTDTTAAGAGWNGAGQFVLRAKDAEFSDRVQRLTANGFEPAGTTGAGRSRSVVDAFSADWMWVAALDAFAIAHQTDQGTRITFWDRDFTRNPYAPLLLPGPWREGPGLVRHPDGSAPVSTVDPCGVIPFDVLRATASNPAPTDLRHFGLDAVHVDGCGDAGRARAVLNGFAVPSPGRTVDVVVNGTKLRVERRSVAERFVPKVLDDRVPALDSLPVVGTISAGAPALRAPGGEVGLLDDHGRLWTVSEQGADANGSTITDVTEVQWDAHARVGGAR